MSMRERLEIEFGCYLDDTGKVVCPEEKQEEKRTKRVAVFGSARTEEDTELYAAIRQMSKDLSQNGWIIVTGGGPGSMAAANEGAKDACVNGEVCSLARPSASPSRSLSTSTYRIAPTTMISLPAWRSSLGSVMPSL